MRFYQKEELKEKTDYHLSAEEQHHAKHVLRRMNGEKIELVNGDGALAQGIYSDGVVSIDTVLHKTRPTPSVTLILAQPEPKKISWILEKGTEIGVDHFIIFRGEKSPPQQISPDKQKRYNLILISALKQCQRLYLPTVTYLNCLTDLTKTEGILYYGKIGGPILKSAKVEKKSIIIGCESGFSTKEEDYLENTLKAEGIRLSDNVLRAETAAIVAATLLLT